MLHQTQVIGCVLLKYNIKKHVHKFIEYNCVEMLYNAHYYIFVICMHDVWKCYGKKKSLKSFLDSKLNLNNQHYKD